MVPIAFYHTIGDTPAALDSILPPLLEKALKGANRVLLIAPTPARQQRLDETLWAYAESAFLPHGKPDDGTPATQPILIVTAEDDLTKHLETRIPVLLAGAESALPNLTAHHSGGGQNNPSRILYLFTASTADVERGRTLFKTLKTAGHPMSYHQQTASGWEKKA